MSESIDCGTASEAAALRASIPSAAEIPIPNPVRWYYQRDEDAEWWHRGGYTREDAISAGIAQYDSEPFWIAECKSMVPNFAIFDGDDICERLGEDEEAWWEDGWTGEPGAKAKAELERRLEATFKAWFSEFATLDGACLNQLSSERITAQAIDARQGGNGGAGAVHGSAEKGGLHA